jgi:hypothetical protein
MDKVHSASQPGRYAALALSIRFTVAPNQKPPEREVKPSAFKVLAIGIDSYPCTTQHLHARKDGLLAGIASVGLASLAAALFGFHGLECATEPAAVPSLLMKPSAVLVVLEMIDSDFLLRRRSIFARDGSARVPVAPRASERLCQARRPSVGFRGRAGGFQAENWRERWSEELLENCGDCGEFQGSAHGKP